MARLAAGVRKRSDGTFEKRFTVDGNRYSVYGKTQKEVQEKEREMRKQIEAGLYTSNRNITLSEYFKEWQTQRKGIVKLSTEIATESKFRVHIKPVLGDVKIQKIEKRQIVQLQQKLAETHKPVTVNTIMVTLSSILRSAVDDEIITKNPAASVKKLRTDGQVKATETIHRALTLEEQKSFLEESQNDWLSEFYAFSLCTGMRIGELGALLWSDIDYINGVIHITKTIIPNMKDENGNYLVTTPKSKTSTRDIPLNDLLRTVLKRQKEKMTAVYGEQSLLNHVFCGGYGAPISSANVNGSIENVLKRLEEKEIYIERFSHHAFRDTFATRYIEAGGNMQTLKQILGHASLAMTADLYAHVLPDTKKTEMEQIQSAFIGVVGH